jgi:hypothetical protein
MSSCVVKLVFQIVLCSLRDGVVWQRSVPGQAVLPDRDEHGYPALCDLQLSVSPAA